MRIMRYGNKPTVDRYCRRISPHKYTEYTVCKRLGSHRVGREHAHGYKPPLALCRSFYDRFGPFPFVSEPAHSKGSSCTSPCWPSSAAAARAASLSSNMSSSTSSLPAARSMPLARPRTALLFRCLPSCSDGALLVRRQRLHRSTSKPISIRLPPPPTRTPASSFALGAGGAWDRSSGSASVAGRDGVG